MFTHFFKHKLESFASHGGRRRNVCGFSVCVFNLQIKLGNGVAQGIISFSGVSERALLKRNSVEVIIHDI